MCDAESTQYQQAPETFPGDRGNAGIVAIHTYGYEELSGTSYKIRKQANIVQALVDNCILHGRLNPRDVGVITWYGGQRKLLCSPQMQSPLSTLTQC